ncbi:GDSL-type esterase/lipase family protein [Mycoplasma marinum]|uniref:SGNH hydrolase-type esterase domain-containing protein n=1 Tax=Mycoplasma marinum TaxID=1937190 RepID=A0A4V2NI85_9MOLU|nr:GDSL-type esterase/lipase family protein [Mycoplasma marinum]TCG11468.1 hypothetical protein C4B24_01780 [Mycoplasma marinum]
MTKTTKKIILGSVTMFTAIAAPIATVISCGDKKSDIRKKGSSSFLNTEARAKYAKDIAIIKNADNDSNPIIDNDKVNIVSLGDSVAAGYTQLDGKDHRGFMNSKKEISGISYGSYLARAFKKHNKLADFNNFAIGGSTTTTLRNQVDPSYKLDSSSEGLRDVIISKLVNPIPGEAKRFSTIQEKLKEANLITISIGANDILGHIKLGGLTISQILTQGIGNLKMTGGLSSLITYDKEKIKTSIQKANQNLMATIAKIKEINPTAKISIIGYPMPITQLASILKLVTDDEGKPVVEKILGAVDGIGRDIARRFKTIDFIDGYIQNAWDKNALELAPELVDIHPGARGYRKIASTILANWAQDKTILSKTGNEPFEKSFTKNRLKETYTPEINDLSNLSSTLSPEATKIESLAKPYKLVHFAAAIVPKIISVISDTNADKTTSTTKPAVSVYKSSKSKSSLDIKEVFSKITPFINSLFRSADIGLLSNDKKIVDGTRQDLEFIFALLAKKTKDMPLVGPMLRVIIENSIKINSPEKSSAEIMKDPVLNVFYDGFTTKASNHKKITHVNDDKFIKRGPADDYTK